jgi:hypothetical protein
MMLVPLHSASMRDVYGRFLSFVDVSFFESAWVLHYCKKSNKIFGTLLLLPDFSRIYLPVLYYSCVMVCPLQLPSLRTFMCQCRQPGLPLTIDLILANLLLSVQGMFYVIFFSRISRNRRKILSCNLRKQCEHGKDFCNNKEKEVSALGSPSAAHSSAYLGRAKDTTQKHQRLNYETEQF